MNNLTYTIGAHDMKFGVDYSHIRAHSYFHNNTGGTFTFSSLESFAAGLPTTFTQRIGDPRYSYSMYRFSWHLQDTYRLRRNLTAGRAGTQAVDLAPTGGDGVGETSEPPS